MKEALSAVAAARGRSLLHEEDKHVRVTPLPTTSDASVEIEEIEESSDSVLRGNIRP